MKTKDEPSVNNCVSIDSYLALTDLECKKNWLKTNGHNICNPSGFSQHVYNTHKINMNNYTITSNSNIARVSLQWSEIMSRLGTYSHPYEKYLLVKLETVNHTTSINITNSATFIYSTEEFCFSIPLLTKIFSIHNNNGILNCTFSVNTIRHNTSGTTKNNVITLIVGDDSTGFGTFDFTQEPEVISTPFSYNLF